MEDTDCIRLRSLILNAKEPFLIKGRAKCSLLNWSLDNWSELLGNEVLQFRCGKNHFSEEPQWESTCTQKQAQFKDFLEDQKSSGDEWWYFDYKHLCQWFIDKDELKQSIDWSSFGFPEISSNDSTLWVGSKGAHTPCHVDTYGCNLVLQVHGRKLWLLFPPEQNLKPTRVPFEESSIYSKLNFFSPKPRDFKGISHCRKIVLEPGDALVVPHKWWHYVENLDTAISVNTWLPLPQDDFQRLKESVATIFVGSIIKGQKGLEDLVLNPNMAEDFLSLESALDIIKATKDKCKQQKPEEKENCIDRLPNVFQVPPLSETEFKALIDSQSGRFPSSIAPQSSGKKPELPGVVELLEVVTDDEVLDLIARKLVVKL